MDSCHSKQGVQVFTSSSRGLRFLGGLHFTMLVMYTSLRVSPTAVSIFVRSFPAEPMKGLAVSSSFLPGPSPINTIGEFRFPSPGTVFSLSSCRRHRIQVAIFASSSCILFCFLSSSMGGLIEDGGMIVPGYKNQKPGQGRQFLNGLNFLYHKLQQV